MQFRFEEIQPGNERAGGRACRPRIWQGVSLHGACHADKHCGRMDPHVQGRRQGGVPGHGIQAQELRLRDEARRRARLRRPRDDQAGGHAQARHRKPDAAEEMGEGVPRGRSGSPEAQTEGAAAERRGQLAGTEEPRAGAGGGEPQAQGRGGVPKKLRALEAAKRAPGRNAR